MTAVINLHGVSTNESIICFIAMQTYDELMMSVRFFQIARENILLYLLKIYICYLPDWRSV